MQIAFYVGLCIHREEVVHRLAGDYGKEVQQLRTNNYHLIAHKYS